MRRASVVLTAVVGLAAFAGVRPASATSISTLSACAEVTGVTNVNGGCSTGPYGTVTLTPDGSNVDVTVTLDAGFYFTDSSGAGKALLFNLGGLPATDIVINTLGFVLDPQSPVGGSFVGAAGTHSFEYGIECGDSLTNKLPCPGMAGGSAQDATTFSFSVDNATIASFVTNTDGFLFESSVFSSAANSGTGGTGEVTSTTLTTVPEPSTLLLLAAGVFGTVRFASRRRRARV